MTNLTNFFQNPHEQAEKMTSEQLEEERLRAKLTEKLELTQAPYSKRNKPLYRASIAFANLGTAYSFFTGAFAGAYLLRYVFNFLPELIMWIISIAMGIGLSVLLEYAKRPANDNFWFKLIFVGKFSFPAFGVVAGLMVVSIGSSFYAATLFPQTFTSPPPILSQDSIKNYFDAQIATKNNQITDISKKGTWKGTLIPESRAMMASLNESIKMLEQKRDVALIEASKENEKRLSSHSSTNENIGTLLGWITLCAELLFVFCFWYKVHYLFKCAKERRMLGASHQHSANAFNKSGGFDPNLNQIGFFNSTLPFDALQNMPQTPVITSDTEKKILIKNTATHVCKITGDKKEMSSAEVQKHINTYESRVIDSIDKIAAEAGDNFGNVKVLRDRLDQLLYWYARKDEILDNLLKVL